MSPRRLTVGTVWRQRSCLPAISRPLARRVLHHLPRVNKLVNLLWYFLDFLSLFLFFLHYSSRLFDKLDIQGNDAAEVRLQEKVTKNSF